MGVFYFRNVPALRNANQAQKRGLKLIARKALGATGKNLLETGGRVRVTDAGNPRGWPVGAQLLVFHDSKFEPEDAEDVAALLGALTNVKAGATDGKTNAEVRTLGKQVVRNRKVTPDYDALAEGADAFEAARDAQPGVPNLFHASRSPVPWVEKFDPNA